VSGLDFRLAALDGLTVDLTLKSSELRRIVFLRHLALWDKDVRPKIEVALPRSSVASCERCDHLVTTERKMKILRATRMERCMVLLLFPLARLLQTCLGIAAGFESDLPAA
jgi:hypothetical protein